MKLNQMKSIAGVLVLSVGFLLGATPAWSYHAQVRVINMSPNSPPFDFCNNLEPFGEGLGYQQTSGYESVVVNGVNIFTRLFPGHACVEDLELNRNMFPPLGPGTSVSAIAIGDFFDAPAGALIGPPALIAFDNNNAAPNGSVKVRFFNLAINGAGTVDLIGDGEVIAADVDAITTGTVLVVTDYAIVPRGRTHLEVEDSSTGEMLGSVHVNLSNRGVYTIYFIGDASGGLGLDIAITRDDKRRGRFLP